MPPSNRDLNVTSLVVIIVAAAMLLVSVVTGTQAWFEYEQSRELARKDTDQPYTQLQQMNHDQAAVLREAHDRPGTNEGDTIRTIPIREAMRRVAADYAK